MYYHREMESALIAWSERSDRKPLILRGARQTGKSTLIREFGKRFDLLLELNLEKRVDLSLVRSCSGVEDLVLALNTRHNIEAAPEKTLIFLDEIQESPEAITWLRFFREDYPEFAVIAAGSLLEVRLEEKGFSFPVGRTIFRTLRPFSFFEFLRAKGKNVLEEKLLEAAAALKPIPPPLHDQAIDHLREYIVVGGMPEAVSIWIATGVPSRVREVHTDLVQALAEDIQKYRGKRNIEYLEAAFDNLIHHFGTRFKYENFAPGYRSQLMKLALGRLEGALLVNRVIPTSSLELPLHSRPKSASKLLPLDMGLALYMMGSGLDHLIQKPFHQLLDGKLAEMFVGQQLLAARNEREEPLHFWVRETSRGNAEVDFLLPSSSGPVPVEVKSGPSGSLKSLHQFLSRSGRNTGIRLHTGNITDEHHEVIVNGKSLEYRLISLPIYLAGTISNLIEGLPA